MTKTSTTNTALKLFKWHREIVNKTENAAGTEEAKRVSHTPAPAALFTKYYSPKIICLSMT